MDCLDCLQVQSSPCPIQTIGLAILILLSESHCKETYYMTTRKGTINSLSIAPKKRYS